MIQIFRKLSQPGSFLATCTNPYKSWEKLHRRRLKLRLRECTECTTARSGHSSDPKTAGGDGCLRAEWLCGPEIIISSIPVEHTWEGILTGFIEIYRKIWRFYFCRVQYLRWVCRLSKWFSSNSWQNLLYRAEARARHFPSPGLKFNISTLTYSL